MSDQEQKPTVDPLVKLCARLVSCGTVGGRLYMFKMSAEEHVAAVAETEANLLALQPQTHGLVVAARQAREIVRKEVLAEVIAKAGPEASLNDPDREGWATAFENLIEWMKAEIAPPIAAAPGDATEKSTP